MKKGDRVVIISGWVGEHKHARGTFEYADNNHSYYITLDEDYGCPRPSIKFRQVFVSLDDVIPEQLYGTKLYKVLA